MPGSAPDPMIADERVRSTDQPEWVRDVIGGLRSELADLRRDNKHIMDLEISQAKHIETMARYGETMVRYGVRIDALSHQMHELEKAMLGAKVKILWSFAGALGGAFLALAIWVVSNSGMALHP